MIYSNWLREKSHNAIKFGEAEGNPCALKYSKGKKLKNYEIYGNSVQETRSGKNLLKNTAISQRINGVWFTVYPQGGVRANGTNSSSTDDIVFDVGTFIPDKSSTYTFSGGNAKGSEITFYLSVFLLNGEEIVHEEHMINANGLTIDMSTITEEFTVCKVSIVVKASSATSALRDFYPMVELGTEKTDYEQYGAMPSPEYPSEIKSVGDLVTDTSSEYYGKYCIPLEVIKSRNLIDFKDINSWTKQNMPIPSNGQYYQIRLHEIFSVNTTLTFHFEITENIPPWLYMQTNDDDLPTSSGTTLYFTTNSVIRKSLTFTIREGCFYTLYPASAGISNTTTTLQTWLNKFEYMQIELGSTQSEYEPYTSSTQHIYLDEPLRGIGEYSDYIDFRNKKVVRNIVKMNLHDLPWKTTSTASLKGQFWAYPVFDIDYAEGSSGVSNFLCTVYRVVKYNQYTGNDNIIYSSSNTQLIYVKDTDYTDLETFKNEIQGELIAQLATPIEEPINNLPDIITNNGETCIIRLGSKIQPSNIKVKYIRL